MCHWFIFRSNHLGLADILPEDMKIYNKFFPPVVDTDPSDPNAFGKITFRIYTDPYSCKKRQRLISTYTYGIVVLVKGARSSLFNINQFDQKFHFRSNNRSIWTHNHGIRFNRRGFNGKGNYYWKLKTWIEIEILLNSIQFLDRPSLQVFSSLKNGGIIVCIYPIFHINIVYSIPNGWTKFGSPNHIFATQNRPKYKQNLFQIITSGRILIKPLSIQCN